MELGGLDVFDREVDIADKFLDNVFQEEEGNGASEESDSREIAG
jgi:hypothetical protein